MTMTQCSISIQVRWWVKPFILLLAGICHVTGWKPSEAAGEKLVTFIAKRGFRYTTG